MGQKTKLDKKIVLIRSEFSRANAPSRPSFREQELAEERRQKEERRKEDERWKEEKRRRKRQEREEAEEREREYWRMNTVTEANFPRFSAVKKC